jgi:hypothetical protein
MGINSKDPEVDAMAPELAARRSTTLSDAVRQALRAAPARSSRPSCTTRTACRMGVIVIATSALMVLLLQESDAEVLLDTATRTAVGHLCAASRLERGLVAESERNGVDATDVMAAPAS